MNNMETNVNNKRKLSDAVSCCVTDSSEAVRGVNRTPDAKQWLAAFVRMNHEKKTSELLTRMGIENYLPIQEQYHQWSDRKKKVNQLIISMLVFVNIRRSERLEVLSLPSVFRFITMPGKSVPAVIPDIEMQKFRYMLDYSDECIHISNGGYKIGESVKVIKGPLMGMKGKLIMIDGNTNVAVQLQGIGYAYVNMPTGYIERLPE